MDIHNNRPLTNSYRVLTAAYLTERMRSRHDTSLPRIAMNTAGNANTVI